MTLQRITQPPAQRPSGSRSKLTAVAATMYSNVVRPRDWDRTKLQNGLDIILHRVDETRWRLALARESVYPSESEVAIIRDTFDVPDAAEESRSEKQHTHPKTHREITYRRVEITWQER